MKKIMFVSYAFVMFAGLSGTIVMADDTDWEKIKNRATVLAGEFLDEAKKILPTSDVKLTDKEKAIIYGSAALAGATIGGTLGRLVFKAGTKMHTLVLGSSAAAGVYLGAEKGLQHAQKTGNVAEGAAHAVLGIIEPIQEFGIEFFKGIIRNTEKIPDNSKDAKS